MRTAIKKVRLACQANDKAKAIELNKVAFSIIDRAVTKGIVPKKTAARQKSNLQNLINSLA